MSVKFLLNKLVKVAMVSTFAFGVTLCPCLSDASADGGSEWSSDQAALNAGSDSTTTDPDRINNPGLPPLLPGESVPDGSVSPKDQKPRRSKMWTTSGSVSVPPAPVAPSVDGTCNGDPNCTGIPENLAVIVDPRRR